MKIWALFKQFIFDKLFETAEQAQQYKLIINIIVKKLFKAINWIELTFIELNEKKSQMLIELKSFIIYHECFIIFIIFNLRDLHFFIFLYYAKEKINLKCFLFKWYMTSHPFKMMFWNFLAVIKYFHTFINIIIEVIFKKEMFKDFHHYYDIIKYQDRETLHIHMMIWFHFIF